jgi:AcrR family transcriptional regulator
VPSGLIFYYFPSKEALLLDLLEERHVGPALRAALAAWPHADLRTALVDIGLRFLRALQELDELVLILFREAHSRPAVADRFRRIREENIAAVAAYLDEAVRDRRLRPVDTRALARVFASSILFAAVIERPPDPERTVEETVAVLLAGLVRHDG